MENSAIDAAGESRPVESHMEAAVTTRQVTEAKLQEITLTCVDCGAGGTLSWDSWEHYGFRISPGISYRCQACAAEKKKKQNRLIEAGVFERIDQLLTGIREVRDLVQEP